MKRSKLIPIAVLAMWLLALPAHAEIPKDMTVQGQLTDDNGNPLSNGWYYVELFLYDALTGGNQVWSADSEVQTIGGVFTVKLDLWNLSPDAYANALWLEIALDNDPPMSPRIPLNAAPYAQRAVLAEALVGGGSGTDNDWLITGNDIYRVAGRVYIGTTPSAKANPPREGEKGENRNLTTSKFIVAAATDGIYSTIYEPDIAADGRAGLFAVRNRSVRNDGSGLGPNNSNTAVTGYNMWGDSYTFGVAGYTWFDYPHTAGVIGSSYNGSNWGAFAYVDDASTQWGIYTPTDLHVGGLIETDMLTISNGAVAGHILTSDASGNAYWAAPGAAVNDGDWVIQGNHLTRDATGVVALGTDTPIPLLTSWIQPTLQVSAAYSPAVVLDRTSGTFTRWSMYQDGNPGRLNFGRSATAGVLSMPLLTLNDREVLINNEAGHDVIRMDSEDSMEGGPVFYMYNPESPSTSSVVLDGHAAGGGGGALYLSDGTGNLEVSLHANYAGTGDGRIITPVLEITGGSDLSEQFDIKNADLMPEPGMVVCIDPDHPGQLSLSESMYDRRVAGVISGAGGVNTGMLMGQRGSEADGELPVALVGRVYVWADADSGSIEPGDLLTTAARPGHAMKVADHDQATGAILGKAMTGLTEGQGLILTLVSLQ